MKVFLIAFALLASFITESYAQKSQEITVQILIPPKGITRIRFANDSCRIVALTFINRALEEKIVSHNAIVTKPTFFKYSLTNGENIQHNHYFLANPGDTVKLRLDQSIDIKFEDESKKFVEDMIDLSFDAQSNEDHMMKNNLMLDSLLQNGVIHASTEKSIRLFSEIKYQLHTINTLNSKIANNEKLEKQLAHLEARFDDLKSINAIELMDLFVKLIYFKTLEANRSPSLINFIQIAQQNVHNEKFLDNYINRMLQIFPEKSSSEYKEAITYLGINENTKLSNEVLNLNLISAAGTNSKIIDELNQLPEGGILVLDFWASWCSPCIAELPFLGEHKKALAKLPIHFVPINMDYDKDDKKWRDASSKHADLFQTKNYRATDEVKKQLSVFFKINSIPRYIVVNKQGEVINFNLNRPSEKEFKTELMNYIK